MTKPVVPYTTEVQPRPMPEPLMLRDIHITNVYRVQDNIFVDIEATAVVQVPYIQITFRA